jgi:hypothetical protein
MRPRALTVRLVVATVLGLLLLGHLHQRPAEDAGLAAHRTTVTVRAASPAPGPAASAPDLEVAARA